MAESKRKRKKKPFTADEIPVASFSDIAFLLIIFFILATVLVNSKGFITDLPSGERGEEKESKATTINLKEDNIFLDNAGTPITIQKLRRELTKKNLNALPPDDENRVVMLEAEPEVQYQLYYQTLHAIQQAGGVVAIVSEEEEGG